MKKLLLTAAFLTVLPMLCPLLAFPGQALLAEKQTARSAPTAPEDRTVVEAPLYTRQVPSKEKSYDESVTVRLYTGGTIRELSLRNYLIGVVAAEMPASFPEEALKAQAIAARTYTLYKLRLYEDPSQAESHHGAQLCDDPAHCAAFTDLAVTAASLWGESKETYSERVSNAVCETDGMLLAYDNAPIAAVFCAASGKMTESAKDVWGADIPYLVPVDSPGGEDCAKYYGEKRITRSDFCAAFLKEYPSAVFSENDDEWFRSVHRTESGSIRTITVGGVEITGTALRSLLGLNSANFTLRREGDELVFSTEGYGHGVGMSQYGARCLALSGQSCDEILSHYYPGTVLQKKNPDA